MAAVSGHDLAPSSPSVIFATMDKIHSAALGAVGGAMVVVAFVWARQAAEGPAVDPSPAPVTGTLRDWPVSPAVTTSTGADLAPIAARLDELTERLRALDAKVDAVLAAPARVAVGESPSQAVDADALFRAMEQVEQKKLEALSDDALLQSSRVAMKAGNAEDAVRRLETLLQRPLTPEKRSDLMMELGMHYRTQATEASLAASNRTLQAVIDSQGIGSRVGVAAANQLAWTCLAQKDASRALAHAEAAARSSGATPEQRIHARWTAAIAAQSLGDRVRARSDFQALLRELEGQPNYEWLVADIRERLQRL